VITLTLLHPIKNTPVQSWTFEHETTIRMGRATDNQVVLYSAVVSRRHVELVRKGTTWEVVNLGANGTFLEGERVNRTPALEGMVIRLARSGPSIQINLAAAVQPVESTPVIEPSPSHLDQRAASAIEQIAPSSQDYRSYRPDSTPSMAGSSSGSSGSARYSEPTVTSARSPLDQNARSNGATELNIDFEIKPLPTSASAPLESAISHEAAASRSSVVSDNELPVGGDIIQFSLETGQPLQVIQSIGRYQIVKILFQSSSSITYLAWRDGRSLALKTLNANWMDYAEACSILEQEARILHQLRHPGIPQLIDFFWVDGQPYLAREMLYGSNLEHYVAHHGPVPPRQAVNWMIQVCDVLNHLHQQKTLVLHHDIQPQNIIRRATPQGSWEIGVVGLQVSNTLADGGTQMGFPVYIAPEQQEGHPSVASDLYALGPTLLYLLAGKDPESFYQYLGNEYRLDPEAASIHPGLAQVIRTLTEPKSELRYSSARDVAKALQQILNGTSAGVRL
jgi:eukaryotic-like serine/threonine-protein kinase